MSQAPVSYASQIKPLFTQMDQSHMMFMFDLWSYNDVKTNASDIYGAVSNGSMPPPPPRGDGPWTQDKADLFNQWMQDGYQP
jgi:hypothetical protein